MAYCSFRPSMFALLLAIVVTMLPQSCKKLTYPYQTRWEKNYDSYQIGAYINGKEFHEAPPRRFSFNSPETMTCGFSYYDEDSLVIITDSFSYNCLWMDAKGKDFYECRIYIKLDKFSYKPNDTYHFNCTTYQDNFNLFRGQYKYFEDLPLVLGYFKKQPYYEPYFFVTEGEISIGAFDDDGHNIDSVHFNLKAEDENGNVIVVKHGYCKKYAVISL